MRNCLIIVALGLLISATGCRNETAREFRKLEADISSFHAEIQKQENILAWAKALSKRIREIGDLGLRRRLYDDWADAIYSTDLNRIPEDGSSRFGWALKFAYDFTSDADYGEWPRSFTEEWELRFRYLEWLRRQITTLRPSQAYPKDVRMVWGLNGGCRWDVRRESYPKLNEFKCRLGRYEDCAETFASKIDWWERSLDDNDRDAPKHDVATVKTRLTAILGRAVRSKTACHADFVEKRRRDDPYLVPTPNGLIACWSKAEIEKAKRKETL